MLTRRFALCLVLGSLWAGTCAAQDPQSVEGPTPNAVRKITLRQMLKTGLKCRRPEEFQYANIIADMVDTGYLRRHLVLGTFFWARQQSGYIPLPYFQQALYDRARKEGKVVPGLQPGTGAEGF